MDRIYEADAFVDFSFGSEDENRAAPQAQTCEKVIEIESVAFGGIEEEPVASQTSEASDAIDAASDVIELDLESDEEPQVVDAKPAEGDLAELSVYYPPSLCGDPAGKTVQIYVPMSLLESAELASVLPKLVPAPRAAVVAVAPPAEDPELARKKNAMREHLAALREKMYAGAQPEAPAAEAEPAPTELSLVAAAEQIVKQSESERVPAFAVATEEAAASAQRASELSSIVPIEAEQEQINPFDGIRSRTFSEKLAALPEPMRKRYDALNAYLATYKRMRVVSGKKYRTYKSGIVPFLKMAIRGKTLSAYFALDPKEYENTKYIFTDEGESTAFENYPMRLRLSSDRQERWARELVDVIAEKNGVPKRPVPTSDEDLDEEFDFEEGMEAEAEVQDPFAALKRKKQKTFKQKLRAGTKQLRERYKALKAHIQTIDGVRIIESNKSETYKRASKPIAKLTVKGKTLNAYLALPPAEYAETKYVFTDASEIKVYEKYPMRVKITSDRQERWTKELVDEIATRENLKKK